MIFNKIDLIQLSCSQKFLKLNRTFENFHNESINRCKKIYSINFLDNLNDNLQIMFFKFGLFHDLNQSDKF